jgi:hypothetical protein
MDAGNLLVDSRLQYEGKPLDNFHLQFFVADVMAVSM